MQYASIIHYEFNKVLFGDVFNTNTKVWNCVVRICIILLYTTQKIHHGSSTVALSTYTK